MLKQCGGRRRVRTARRLRDAHTGAVRLPRRGDSDAGTYLSGRTIVEVLRTSGPTLDWPRRRPSARAEGAGLTLRRFKTGTPPRVNARTVDLFKRWRSQPGDEKPQPFSFSTESAPVNSAVCYLTYTNARTHEVIRANLDRSPIYSGVIEGVGPRYCPSIETKG